MKSSFVALLSVAGLLVAVGSAFAQYAPQSAGTEPLSPELEARVLAVGDQIRCATCQGLSIADSPASMARSQLDMVRTLVQEGKTDEEIKQFFVERFGEWALLKPKTEPATALLWAGPVLLLAGGLAFVLWFSVKHKAPNAPAAGSGGETADGARATDAAAGAGAGDAGSGAGEDDYLRRVRQELEP